VGLVLAALFAFNPLLIWYSQEARSYGLAVLLVTIGLAFFASALRSPTPRALAGWAAASALALGSHYFAAFVVAPQAAWLLLRARPGPRAVAAVAAVAAIGLALLPLALAQQGDDRRDGFTERPVLERAAELGVSYAAGPEPRPLALDARVDAIQLGAAAVLLALVALAAVLVLRRGTPEEREAGMLCGLLTIAAAGVPIALALGGLDLFNPRNALVALVPLLALVAVGGGGARAGRAGVAVAAAGCLAFAGASAAILVSDQMQRPDWRGAAAALGDPDGRRLIVGPQNGDDPLAYYTGAAKLHPRAASRPLRVRRIDVVSTDLPVNAHPGFELARETRRAPRFHVWTFTSPRSRAVRPDVAAEGILSERWTLLLDERERE